MNYTTFGITMQRPLVCYVKSPHVNFRVDFNIPFTLAPIMLAEGDWFCTPNLGPKMGPKFWCPLYGGQTETLYSSMHGDAFSLMVIRT